MKINERIKFYRLKLGWNQKMIVHASGVSQAELSKVEKGTIIPSIKTLAKIAKALKVSLEELQKGTSNGQLILITKPQSDEEALILKYYLLINIQKSSDSKYAILKELLLEIGKFQDRKENYLCLLREAGIEPK